jgi:hypothetical protein
VTLIIIGQVFSASSFLVALEDRPCANADRERAAKVEGNCKITVVMLLQTLTRDNLPYILARLSGCCLLVVSFVGCAHPEEYLQVGDTIIYAHTIDNIAEKLQHSFPEYGESTLRAHLLMNGLGEAEILHQSHPKVSQDAFRKLSGILDKYKVYKPVELLDSGLIGLTHEKKISSPAPSHLGAGVAAAVAILEDGEWSPPIYNSVGWSIVFLNERKSGQRSTAGVDVDIFQIEIADATIYSANRKQWQRAPLLGSDKLISCLPYEFRNKTSRE